MLIGEVAYWAADDTIPLVEISVGAALTATAAERPYVDALRWLDGDESRSLSYSDLLLLSQARAQEILSGAAPGDRVVVWAPNSIEWIVLEYASALAGTVLVPVNPAAVDRELEHVLSVSGAVRIYTVRDSNGKPLLDRARAIQQRSPLLREVVDLSEPPPEGRGPLPEVAPRDPFVVQFTSGTTGAPKGAVLSHHAAYNAARMYGVLLAAGVEHQVSCAPLPLHHVAGSVSRLLGSLAVGGTMVVLPNSSLEGLAAATVRCGATHGGLIGKLAVDLLESPDALRVFDGHQLRTVGMGGAGTAPELVRRVEEALGVKVVNGYGQSESPHITLTVAEDSDHDRWYTIGRPVPQRDVCILRQDGSFAAIGETGEICTRGPLIMDGYISADTGRRGTTEDGWLHTGDLGRMDERGYLYFTGRVRDMIIRGGENIYPAEIEGQLTEHDEILEAVVVGVPDERWGEQVMAYVRLAPGSSLDQISLREYARSVLAPYKVPAFWKIQEEFPRNALGKVLRSELAAQGSSASAGSSVARPTDAALDQRQPHASPKPTGARS